MLTILHRVQQVVLMVNNLRGDFMSKEKLTGFINDAKAVTLHSFNPDYKDRVFEGIEITKLRVLGIVKRVIKEI